MDMGKEYELASIKRRLGALLIDGLIIFFIWYLVTISDLALLNDLIKVLDPDIPGSLDLLVETIFKVYIAFIFKWVAVSTIVYTVIPAIIGDGKTIGKLLLGMSVISNQTNTEVSPSRLILREFIGRNLIETLCIIPGVISIFMVIIRKDAKSIHDLLSHTIVVKKTTMSTY